MASKRKPKSETGWQAYRMRGASMTSLGIVYAVDETAAVDKAAEQYRIPAELRSRIVVRPWQP